MKAPHTLHLASDYVLEPWGGESATLIPASWMVDGHVVIENDKQEERHAQHVGEHGELHVRDHADQLGSVPTRSGD